MFFILTKCSLEIHKTDLQLYYHVHKPLNIYHVLYIHRRLIGALAFLLSAITNQIWKITQKTKDSYEFMICCFFILIFIIDDRARVSASALIFALNKIYDRSHLRIFFYLVILPLIILQYSSIFSFIS